MYRAALSFQAAAGIKVAAHLDLRKRIPRGRGFGRRLHDAAGTLMALNRLYGSRLDGARLHDLAAGLGADVPFFLGQGPAVGRGTGTELTPHGPCRLIIICCSIPACPCPPAGSMKTWIWLD